MAPPPSKLDFEQILPAAFDEPTGSLRTTATLVASGETQIIVSNTEDSIAIGTHDALFTSTTVGSDIGLDVNIIGGGVTGQIQVTGLSTGLDSRAILINDVATRIPDVALANRNGMSVRVVTQGITVFFGNNTVTPINGYPKFYGEEIILDIRANPAVDLWAVCSTGITGELRILQVA